jgi:23S rRNA pseudouridine1911/1915/1917 synthase
MTGEAATPRRQLIVAPEDSSERLDRYLAAQLPELSRTRLQELTEEGFVLVDGRAARPSHRVRPGETIEVEVRPRAPLIAEPEDIPLEILYEDADVVVVNKPAGMSVHAGAGHSRGTLVNALLHRRKKLSSVGGELRPGIVHRLDRGTSGALIVAKHDVAHAKLAEQFRLRRIEKTYLAFVHGKLTGGSGRIELPIARDPRRRVRMTARRVAASRHAREARTDWRVLAHLDGFTLVEVDLRTGRTHQIRVHFSALHHPVVGDTLYGAPKNPRLGKQALPLLQRNFLHAARVAFAQPATGERIVVRAPLPPDLRGYLMRIADATGKGPAVSAQIDAALRTYL